MGRGPGRGRHRRRGCHRATAVVTGQVRIDIVVDGKPKIMHSRYTDVWVKGAKGWQMVAWQSTGIP